MAYILRTNGEREDVTPNNGRDFSLEELKGMIDGWIELIHLSPDEDMIVDEEGRLKGKEVNPYATGIYKDATGIDCPIVGDVVICLKSQIK